MRRLWKSLSFSFELKLGRLAIAVKLEPSAAETERQATGEP